MTDIALQVWILAGVWLSLAVWCLRSVHRSGSGSVGLPFAFLFSMAFQYSGFLAYAIPGYSHLRATGDLYLQSYQFTEETVILGVQASVLGVAGFSVACIFLGRRERSRRPTTLPPTGNRSGALRILLAVGVLGFILDWLQISFPMSQAISQAARNVAIASICLGVYLSYRDRRPYGRWLATGLAIPLYYLLLAGFTSYGFIVLTIYAGFWLCATGPIWLRGWRLGAGLSVATYCMLSLFVTWMSFREELRSVLWGDAGLVERFTAVAGAVSRTKLLSPWDFDSLDLLNVRLNQYVFIGKMMEMHLAIPELRLHGETIYAAFLVWIPRFIWPGKPEAGGNSFVAENTGMTFSSSAAFGSGPVFEFYANFGYLGVFIGFFFLGLFLRIVDRHAAVSLHRGRFFEAAKWMAVGFCFIAPLNTIFIMINSAALTLMLMVLITVIAGGDERRVSRGISPQVSVVRRGPKPPSHV